MARVYISTEWSKSQQKVHVSSRVRNMRRYDVRRLCDADDKAFSRNNAELSGVKNAGDTLALALYTRHTTRQLPHTSVRESSNNRTQ